MSPVLHFFLVAIAILALLGVILEEKIHVNKAKVTLFLGSIAWMLLFLNAAGSPEGEHTREGFAENLGEISSLWIFLMAAMTFVAYLNKKGVVESLVYLILPKSISERSLLFLVGTFCFFFSSLADNITATLVSMTLILSLKMPVEKTLRFCVMAIFAVNSGGVALITGDVTTLMIFLAGKVTIGDLLILSIPAYIAVLFLGILLARPLKGQVQIEGKASAVKPVEIGIGILFLFTIISTIFLNAFYSIPPVLTFLLGLSAMFLIARFFDEDDDREPILEYIRTIEFETLLFFLGILLLVGMLKEIGVLASLGSIYTHVPASIANYLVGLLSATIDNVPLTAALLKTGLEISRGDWLALTYAVGVGGASLVIGSAAGIVAMSKYKELTFMTYLKFLPFLLTAYTLGYGGALFFSGLFLSAT